jgi:nucleoside-diphosphate-sugar epimerase
MRVFVTGATGFIGFAIVKELIAAGHQVTGLARSEASGRKLIQAGAKVQIGSIENLDRLRRAAATADGVVHTAFYHKPSHIPLSTRLRIFLGGSPAGMTQRYWTEAIAADRRAIEAIGASLARGSAFATIFGTLGMTPGKLAVEDKAYDPSSINAIRAKNEDVLKQFASRGVRTSAIRLPPIVHGPGGYGFASLLIPIARKKKESAYVGDGSNRWPSVHHRDAARLFRLALEEGPAGGTYHGVAEDGIPFHEIAGVIGHRLNVPVVSKSKDQVAKHFGPLVTPVVPIDNPTSNSLTRERLGWNPAEIGLLAELEQADFSTI